MAVVTSLSDQSWRKISKEWIKIPLKQIGERLKNHKISNKFNFVVKEEKIIIEVYVKN